jgi:RNA-directed DNA polymerase
VCPTKAKAEAALATLAKLLAELGLRVAEAKTRLVDTDSGQGFDFLGFHHRKVRSFRNPKVKYVAQWPSQSAMRRARTGTFGNGRCASFHRGTIIRDWATGFRC